MKTGQLKKMLAGVGADLPVMVKTAEGWKHVILACEEILWTEKTPPGVETEAFFLELYPTEEELEPYFAKENREEVWWEVLKRDEEGDAVFVALFNTETHPNAKAAAEAECDRLNAEYRKEPLKKPAVYTGKWGRNESIQLS